MKGHVITVSAMRNSLQQSIYNLGILLDTKGSLPAKVGSECTLKYGAFLQSVYECLHIDLKPVKGKILALGKRLAVKGF